MLRWKSSLKPAAAAAPAADITFEDSAVTTATSFASPTNIDVNIPAVSTDDILILFSTTNDFSEPTASPPSGWTKIVEKDGNSSGHSTVAAYWKRASSTAAATTETWSAFFPNGEYYYIWVGAYSGCVTSGSPVDAYGTAAFGFSSSWSVDVTTTVDNAMVVTISGSTNNSVTQTWADGTELIDTTYASEAAVSINEKLEATSGAKTRSSTASTNTSASMIAVALKPAAATSYAYEEDFEGTGTPTEFTNTIVGSGTIDYDYTTDPGSGSKSLEVVTSGGDSYAELDLGAIYDNFELIFQNKRTGGSSNRKWIRMSDDTNYANNDSITIGHVSGWGYGFNHNFNAIVRSTTGVSTTAWHWVKLRVDIPNTTITLTISASSDFSSPDVASDTSQTFGSNFGGVRYIQFGGVNVAMTTFVDSITLEDLS